MARNEVLSNKVVEISPPFLCEAQEDVSEAIAVSEEQM